MEKLKVVFLCENMFGNPYLGLLTKSLNSIGVQVKEIFSGFLFIFPILKGEKPEIVHFQTLHYYLLGRNKIHRLIKFLIFISQLLILKTIGIKIVWTVHEWTDRFEGGKRNLSSLESILLGKTFHAVITHCNSTKNELVKALRLDENSEKVFVVNHGNYIGYFENRISQIEARNELNLPLDNVVFLLFGTIHRTKGFLEAIDAFKKIEGKNISLLVVGYPAEEDLENLIRDKICECENILFVPRRIDDEEIQLYMNACDCVIFPYKVFTTSGATILAMSFGKACIAPARGYFKDVLDEFGAFFHDTNNKESLLIEMQSAIENKDNLVAMGKHNLKLAEQWSWDYVAKETYNIYQKCLFY